MLTGTSDLRSVVSDALRLQKAKNWDEAETLYKEVLAAQPEHADALHLYGCLCDELGRSDEALNLIERATQSNPQAYPYFYNLGNLLAKQGRANEAIDCYRKAIALKPDYPAAHNNLGMALRKQGDRAGSKHCFQTAVRYAPNYADAHYNLGLEWRALDNLQAAIASYQTAVRLKPDYADALYAMGNAYSSLNQLDDAKAAYLRSLAAQPLSAKAHTNLGSVYMRLGRMDDALASFESALRIDPQDAFTRSNLILTASYVSADPADTFERCQEWERAHSPPISSVSLHHRNTKEPSRRLRIGYVSADFRSHAAAYWIEPVFQAHRHSEFEVFCYSNSEDSDLVTERLKGHADHWLQCSSFSDDELEQRIRQDAIDILIDLSGHTEGNRLTAFARQPAPVQVSWFGFPVSTGLKSIQYRFTDAVMDPAGENDQFYSESLVRLSRFYAAFKPDPTEPIVGNSPFQKRGYVTFGSFNNFAKITEQMMGLWSEVLLSVPNSRLLVQTAGADEPGLSQRIRTFFTARGVSAKRLELRGWSGLSDYLQLGQQVDIALDPYPFNGGVTTCHALWMGLPVVTLSGCSAASRVGKSILSHIGLPELAAESAEQYRIIAASLANDRQRVTELRATMRARMANMGLLDGDGIAREVEACYRAMWVAWCNNPRTPAQELCG